MDKRPIVRIKNAFLQRTADYRKDGQLRQAYALFGEPIDYPESHMAYPGCVSNKRQVQTSEVVEVRDDVVKTQRTEYHVLNWLTEPDFQTTLGAQFGKDGLTQS